MTDLAGKFEEFQAEIAGLVSAHPESRERALKIEKLLMEIGRVNPPEEYLTIKQILERYTIAMRTAYDIARRYGRKRDDDGRWEVSTRYLPHIKLRKG